MSTKKQATVDQIDMIVRDIGGAFPGWAFYKDRFFFGLWRSQGPIRQNIWFGIMSDGEYRPSHDLTAFVPRLRAIGNSKPWVGMHAQLLSIRSRLQSIRPSQHAARWRDAVAAMEREFEPDIRKPLDIAEVAGICAAEVVGWDQNNLAMIAILYAWLGRRDEARQLCIRLQSIAGPPTGDVMHSWDLEMKAFGLDLARALEAGTEQEVLQPIAHEAATRTSNV